MQIDRKIFPGRRILKIFFMKSCGRDMFTRTTEV
jgi:hypothetical protein